LRDYRRAGVDKDEPTRQELAALHEGMVRTGQKFSRNIREDKRFIELDSEEDLAGLPSDFVAAHQPEEDGKIRITTDSPDFLPFETYAEREDLRRELYLKSLQRGYPANEETLKKLLGLRNQYATILGYPDWAAYNAEDKMIKEKEAIVDFIDQVASIARPRMERDLETLLARKRNDEPQADTFHVWDRFYYMRKVHAEQFGVDSQEVRSYFEFTQVKEGILGVLEELFDVVFKKVESPEVWHESVEAYDVFDDKQPIGRLYLDLHPREGEIQPRGHVPDADWCRGQPVAFCLPSVQLPRSSQL
jgi:thimet oligopeptidase